MTPVIHTDSNGQGVTPVGWWGWLRLTMLGAVAAFLGWTLLAPPGVIEYSLGPGLGSIAVPRSLEGWRLTLGEGDTLVTGQTRLGLMGLELERTWVPTGGDLPAFIHERHVGLFLAHPEFHSLLQGEERSFGDRVLPTARAVYDGNLFGLTVRMVEHDAFVPLKGCYVRVGLRYPLMLDRYFWGDQYFIANNLNLPE